MIGISHAQKPERERKTGMGLTIEDMMVVGQQRYKMELIAGESGWSNSISWIMMIEDFTIINNFSGKELAVTTGLGFDTEEKLLTLARKLIHRHAAGLVINSGYYIMEIPQSLKDLCNENDFPLVEVPWEILIPDMIKEITWRLFEEAEADAEISRALIRAIEEPRAMDKYKAPLLPYFDVDGSFQIVLIHTGNLDTMDTVERRRLSYRLEIYLEHITHNGNLFYYDDHFVLVANAISPEDLKEIVDGFARRVQRKMPERPLSIGIGSPVTDISNLQWAHRRALAACRKAQRDGKQTVYFSEMGVERILYMADDIELLRDMGSRTLKPLLDYDEKHDSNYLETLELYLRYDGSVQKVAEELFTHRNTIVYRMNNIRSLLGSNLDSMEEKMKYQIACMIYRQ